MAKFNNYIKVSDSGSGQTMGAYKVYLNEPRMLVQMDWRRHYCDFWWAINDHYYYNDHRVHNNSGSFEYTWIEYNPYNATTNPNGSLKVASESSPIKVNPVIPVDTKIASRTTPTSPNGYTNHTTVKTYNKCDDAMPYVLGIPIDIESFAVTLKLDYVDNLFNSRYPSFTISGGNVLIKMSSNYSSNNFSDGAGMPRLLKTGKTELDDSTDDVISYQKSSLTYTLPWSENTQRDYRLETQVPSASGNSGESPSVTVDHIDMFNDVLHFKTITIPAINTSTFKVENQTLKWTAPTNASSYRIYVDGAYKDTVSTNSWAIPDDLYIDQKHTYSVSVDDWVKKTYYYQTATGKATPSSASKTFPVLRETYFEIYKGATAVSSNAWKDVGVLNSPTVVERKLKQNSWTFSVSHTCEAPDVRLLYSTTPTGARIEIKDAVLTVDKLKVNTEYNYYFYVETTINGQKYESAPTLKTITPTKLPTASFTTANVTKRSINSYELKFSPGNPKADRYALYFNKTIYKGNATSPILITGWKANQNNEIKIVSVYEEDNTYNNEIVVTFGSQFTPLLKTPALSKKDIRENGVEQGFGDVGSKEIIDNVVTQVDLTWTNVEYASGYVVYDKYKVWNNDIQDWEEGERVYPTQEPDKDTEFMQTTVYKIYMDNVMGYHDYSIRAIASVDEAYNSSVSNIIHLEQNFPLDPPIITGDDTTTTISFEKVKNADFYSIQLIPTRGTTGNLFRSFHPDKYPFSYNYYDMVKDLRETETFDVSVFSRSYNAFYFHPSADSNHKLCEVKKLNTPANLRYNDETGTVFWTGDDRTFEYEVKIKAIDGDWATYRTKETRFTFKDLAPSLYVCYVTALRDDSLTNHQIVYLDSEKSENLTFGLINVPKDFSRHVNQFSWTTVGADRYIFYEWVEATAENEIIPNGEMIYDSEDKKYKFVSLEEGNGTHRAVSITTVDGGGLSLELGMVDGAMYRPTEGKHYYAVQAATTIDDVEYNSVLSDFIEVDIEYLKKLQPLYETDGLSILKWEHLNTNVVYDTRVNNLSEKDWTDENRYIMDKNVAGTYYFKVRAISTVDQFLYQTSTWSDEVPYYVYKLPRPELSLVPLEQEGTGDDLYDFSWNAVENSTGYRLIISPREGETQTYTITTTQYKVGLPEGDYSAYVIALGSTAQYVHPKYIDSENSNIINFGKLGDPEISINENIISWEENQLADYYEIYNYDKFFAQVDNPQFILDVSVPYSYSIRVKSVSLSQYVLDSELSNSIQYIVTQLAPPQNVKLSGTTLSWDLSINADSYRIFIDDTLSAVTSSNKIDLKRVLDEMAGVVRIYVVAFSNKINLLDSDESNYVLKRIEKQKKYNIVIDGVNYDEIQLPFAINETLDDTLDKSELTLAYIDKKEPFERLTPAAIIVYEGAQSSKSYKMIVESDEVAEVQVGTVIRYKHKLQLVERTLILQNEIIPDFTVSTSIGDSLNMKGEIITPTIGSNIIPGREMFSDVDILATGTYNNYTIRADGALGWVLEKLGIPTEITIPLGFVWFFGLGDCVKGNMRKNYLTGDSLPLPIPTSRLCCFHFSIQEIFLEYISDIKTGFLLDLIKAIYRVIKGEAPWWEILVYLFGGTLVQEFYESMKTDNDWPYPARNYYIRPHHDSYAKTDDEKLIYAFNDQFKLTNPSYTLTEEGSYDLIMEIPAVNFQKLNDEGKIGFDAEWFQGSGAEILPKHVDFMKDSKGNPTTFRIVYPGINVVKQIESVQFVSIADVLEKVSVLSGNKYKIDPAVLAITRSKPCPDMTFAGGKYIYDVLEEIGREFSGIPRLLDDNTITFDILDEYTAASRNLNGWRDIEVLSSYAQELDRVTSGFVSRISNMVPDDDYTIYPAPNMWIHPRGEKSTTALVGVDNLAIVLDKPIYKIKQVLVKNAIKGHPDLEIDLTEYVYQDAVYDALNDNNYGKGLALVWSQGENCIKGLGQIPEATKFYAIMGWKDDDYVIQNIIKYYIDMNMTMNGIEDVPEAEDPQKMLFRVEYQGYTDTTAYIENPDKRDNKYTMYTVFNQEANTITDGRFGNGALTQLKRHGGNEIQKKYTCYSVATVPYLGSSINVGNVVYYLDDVQYVFHNKYIEANCTFTKNYNKVNPRVAVNSEYRQYELRADNNVDRVINFNKYCYIGTKDDRHTKLNFENWQTAVKDSLNGNTYNKPDSFYFNCYQNDNLERLNFLSYDDKGTLIHKSVNGIAKPVSYSKVGSSIMFTAKMDDAFTAGQSITKRDLSGYFGYNEKYDKNMVQNYVRYVNDNSFDQTPYMRVTIGCIPNSIKNSAADSYPDVKWLEQPKISMSNALFSDYFKVYKDQREALNFNYQLHFISNRDDIFIHKGFTKYLFKNPNQPEKGIKPIVVGYTNNIRHKDVLDTVYTQLSEVSLTGTNQICMDLNLNGNMFSTTNYEGIAVIWPDTKEILLEIKKPIVKGEQIISDNIWFNFSNEILK